VARVAIRARDELIETELPRQLGLVAHRPRCGARSSANTFRFWSTTAPQNITMHLKELYAEGDLDEEATCKAYLQVRARSRGR
jgi:hypothetical protein